ncbi:MAG: tRNA lysidine(34) synthetase TilS [Puniceicoccales bacterium]|jgi:tRNA(Ile)-lysidine synthase|nr:tRNA lysidine(34) synthetase TilS [Puniceicoccales bacterium]
MGKRYHSRVKISLLENGTNFTILIENLQNLTKGTFMFPKSKKNLLSKFRKLAEELFKKTRTNSKFFGNTETALDIIGDDNYCEYYGPVCIACSGGSDSLFLTLAFCAFCDHDNYSFDRTTILHLNHNLRGEESFQDAEFVAELAEYLGLNFIRGTLNEPPGKLSEETLRNIRYKFFSKQMQAIGSRILFLGQQQNDVAESLIMRLTRASGLEGLSAPREMQKFVDGTVRLRPLLGIKKSEIESVLKQCGVQWRIDLSNMSCNYFRNTVRNIILPELQKAVPQYDIVANMAKSQLAIAEAQDFVEEVASNETIINFADGINVSKFNAMPSSVLRHILRKWLLNKRIELSRKDFENLFDSVRLGREMAKNVHINAMHGKGIVVSQGILMTKDDFANRLKQHTNFDFNNWAKGLIYLPSGKTLSQKPCKIENESMLLECDVCKQAYIEVEDGQNLSVQAFDPKSGYIMFSHKSPKKLGSILGRLVPDYFDKPMVICEDIVCWVPGLAVAEPFKVKNLDRALLLTYS